MICVSKNILLLEPGAILHSDSIVFFTFLLGQVSPVLNEGFPMLLSTVSRCLLRVSVMSWESLFFSSRGGIVNASSGPIVCCRGDGGNSGPVFDRDVTSLQMLQEVFCQKSKSSNKCLYLEVSCQLLKKYLFSNVTMKKNPISCSTVSGHWETRPRPL